MEWSRARPAMKERAGGNSGGWRLEAERSLCPQPPASSLQPPVLPNHDANRRTPEMEVSWIEIEARRRAVVLDVPQITHVAAQADVIREIPHHARAGIPAEVVARRADARNRSAVDLRAQQPDARGDERPDTGPVRAANRHADDHVAHHVDDAVVAEVGVGPEEARAVTEVELAADDARAHPACVDAETGAAVVKVDVAVGEPGTGVRGDPWADVP